MRPAGTVLLRLRRPWRDGARALYFEPSEFLEKLAAVIPRPRINLLIYHGLWTTHFFRGELAETLCHLDEGEPLYDAVADRSSALV